jgi:hypothetical protein
MNTFSWTIFFFTIGVVFIEMLAAWKEKTFSRKQNSKINVYLLRHWGIVIGDLILLPIFNGLIIFYFNFSLSIYVIFAILSFLLTWIAHRLWWPSWEYEFNFMTPNWEASRKNPKHWYKDLTLAGWTHFLFMTAELVIIAGYIFSRVPSNIVWYSFFIFIIFIPVAFIKPELDIKRPMKNIILNAVALYLLLFLVTYLKLH